MENEKASDIVCTVLALVWLFAMAGALFWDKVGCGLVAVAISVALTGEDIRKVIVWAVLRYEAHNPAGTLE